MTDFWLAAYTFGQFLDRAESPTIASFFEIEPSVLKTLEASPGFIARSGYDGDDGVASWGQQVFPRFWVDNGDGWAPSTLSLWESPEALMAATYYGRHGGAYRRGREWNVMPDGWPGYVIWWQPRDQRPDWHEAVSRHERLADLGPTPEAFNFKSAFTPDGQPIELDKTLIRSLAGQTEKT